MPIRTNDRPPTHALEVVYQPIAAIHERPTNARRHPPSQIRAIATSIRKVGFVVPVLVDEANMLLAGHGRLAGARQLGLTSIPTVCVSGLSEADKRALTIADNKLTDLSSFDLGKLRAEFEFLIEDATFTLEDTGFSTFEIDRVLRNHDDDGGGDDVTLPGARDRPVSRLDDLWHIGEHRLICGSALDRSTVTRLLGTERIALTITDPPYNVRIAGNVSGTGKHGEFAMASGEMSPAEFTYQFLRPTFELIRDCSAAGAIGFVFMDWRHTRDVENAAAGVFVEHKNTICWVKSNAALGAFYRSQHEMILVFKVREGKHRVNFGVGGKGRHRSNVWHYDGANSFRVGRRQDLDDHPTVKPLALVRDAILDCSAPRDVVFDAFVGSGTTLIAAATAGRRGYGVEIEPRFVDVAIRRITEATKLTAYLDTGESFDDVRASRHDSLEGLK